MPELFGRRLSRTELERRGGHLSQFGGVRLLVSDNGPSRGRAAHRVPHRDGLQFRTCRTDLAILESKKIDALHERIGTAVKRKTKT